MRYIGKVVLCFMLGSAVPASTFAQDEVDDQQFTEAVKDFGFAGGVAWQCATGEARSDIERQSLISFNGLVRLFGTDEGFFYAAAFGAGTTSVIEKNECEAYTQQFRQGLTDANVE